MCKYVYIDSISNTKYHCSEPPVKDGYCIFHHPDYVKTHPDEVRKAFYEKIIVAIKENKPLVCIGYRLPDIDFEYVREELNLERIVFNNKVDFTKCVFSGHVFLDEITFEEEVSFANAEFNSEVKIDKCEFKDNASFAYSEFNGNVMLQSTKFLQELKFYKTKFLKKKTFDLSHSKITIFDLREAQIYNFARISDTTFGRLFFDKTTFYDDVIFADTEFGDVTNLNKVTFKKIVTFHNIIWSKGVSFAGSRFFGPTYFLYCEFHKDLLFSKEIGIVEKSDIAKFYGTVTFQDVTFRGVSYFARVEFLKKTVFDKVKFNGYTCFWQVKFMDTVQFRDIHFGNLSIFDEAEFEGKAMFEKVYIKPDNFEKNPYFLSFRRVFFKNQERVIFDNIDFSYILLLHTDISRVNFRNVKWLKKNGAYQLLEKRLLFMKSEKNRELFTKIQNNLKNDVIDKIIPEPALSKYYVNDSQEFSDEMIISSLETDLTYENVAQTYRYLRENYEFYLKYDSAGLFFVGEKDTLLKTKKFLSADIAEKTILFLYRGLALYGESIFRPVSLFVFLIFTSFIINLPLKYLNSLLTSIVSPLYLYGFILCFVIHLISTSLLLYLYFTERSFKKEYKIAIVSLYIISYIISLNILLNNIHLPLAYFLDELNFTISTVFQYTTPSKDNDILTNISIIFTRFVSAILLGLSFISIRRKTERKFRH